MGSVSATLRGIQEVIESRYRRRTAKSAALYEAALNYLPGGDTRAVTHFAPYPLFMESGSGCYLKDVDGHTYLDLLNNFSSLIHGHAHPKIADAVHRQLQKGTSYATPTEIQSTLARMLSERVTSIERIRFCNSGSEATMNAIRAAKAFTGRNKIIKIEGGYHGSHDAAEVSVAPPLSDAGPQRAPYSVPSTAGLFRGVVNDVLVAPFNDSQSTEEVVDRCARDLAAVIVEPVMGAAGMIPATHDYLKALRRATRSCGALLIFDEIISFRISYGGAQEVYGINPDLTTLGKIIGGGLPVGAFGGRADVMSLFDPRQSTILHSGTFNGNSPTMVAGIAVLELLTRAEIDRINNLGELLRAELQRVFGEMGIAARLTGTASLLQIHYSPEPVTDYRSAARASQDHLRLLHLSLLNHGIFASRRGSMCISTPMNKTHVMDAVEKIREVVTEVQH